MSPRVKDSAAASSSPEAPIAELVRNEVDKLRQDLVNEVVAKVLEKLEGQKRGPAPVDGGVAKKAKITEGSAVDEYDEQTQKAIRSDTVQFLYAHFPVNIFGKPPFARNPSPTADFAIGKHLSEEVIKHFQEKLAEKAHGIKLTKEGILKHVRKSLAYYVRCGFPDKERAKFPPGLVAAPADPTLELDVVKWVRTSRGEARTNLAPAGETVTNHTSAGETGGEPAPGVDSGTETGEIATAGSEIEETAPAGAETETELPLPPGPILEGRPPRLKGRNHFP